MSYKKDFDLFVGGKSGIFKGVKIEKKACISKNIQNLLSITQEHEVTVMSWGDEDEREVLLGCGTKGDRSVKIYDTEYSAFTSSFTCDIGSGKIHGISRYDDAILTAVESGHIKLWRCDENNQLLIEAGENLNRMRHSYIDKKIIATGGKQHKLKLFDLETKTKTFEEKNVRHDWLEMEVPIWISDIGFMPKSTQIAICSRYGHIRLYDPVAQRRPVIDICMKDQALTSLAIAPRENHVVVGSGKGVMNLIDLRKPGKILNTYKDFVGGITSIACAKSNPYIVSVGLDRYLRVHDMNTKEVLQKTYLTSRLSCMVLRSNFTLEPEQLKTEEETVVLEVDESIQIIKKNDEKDDEYEEMFEKMPVIENEINEANLPENKKRNKNKSEQARKKLKK